MNVNIYNPYVRRELELYHHGIAGQKWGKKNRPPYPLAASDHSASEKKAGWRKSLAEHREVRKLKKRLNKNEKIYAKNKLKEQRHGDKVLREWQLGASSSTAEEAEKHIIKMKDHANKGLFAQSNIKKAEADTWKTIAKLVEKGYNVDTIPYRRLVNKGQMIAGSAIASAGLFGYGYGLATLNMPVAVGSAAGAGVGLGLMEPKYVTANKYKVKKSKDGEGHLRMVRGNEVTDSNFTSVKLSDNETAAKLNNNSNKKQRDYVKEFKKADDHFKELMSGNPTDSQIRKAEANRNKARNQMEQIASRAQSLQASGYTRSEIAKKLGIPEGSISYYINM